MPHGLKGERQGGQDRKAEINAYFRPCYQLMCFTEKVGSSLGAQTEANRFIVSLNLVPLSSDHATDLHPTLKLCLLPQEATRENAPE